MVKRLIYIVAAVLAFAGCQKLVLPKDDGSCTLSGLTVYVYYDEDNMALYNSFDVLSGTFDPETGEGTFTFPKDADLYNAQTLSRCRLEAAIPATAHVDLTDVEGNVLGTGLGGRIDLGNKPVYFDVVAADGSRRHYSFMFRIRR